MKHVLTPVNGTISSDTAVIAAPGSNRAIAIKYLFIQRVQKSGDVTIAVVDTSNTWASCTLYNQGSSLTFGGDEDAIPILPENVPLTIECDGDITYNVQYFTVTV